MKTYFLMTFLLVSSVAISSDELSWVDTQVQAIKPPREGMSNSSVTSISSPFIFLDKKQKKKLSDKVQSDRTIISTSPDSIVSSKPLKHLYLSAIINNSALINGQWYKLNDIVHSYKLSSLRRTSVVLTKGESKLVLSTDSINKNIKFK
ncbi:MAG: hypothetical protein U9N33_02015 [Campylobacterota bacterium]|nr:hypothetical protein [Campylobacterota bacterium]